ncbi:ankyrin repeat domain-containing protein [Sphingomicrobium arenosum]|uniref:ankyrin repeat domain-containing protein n=1 Tax=Sphingomicrobium arenosum TaxID=2233861 RepID=UPI00224104BC|nr:ankyrin repeat domain-containing protein [Sphingomicrobium arenosum]
MFRLLLPLLGLTALFFDPMPASAQAGRLSEGESFIAAVREVDAGKVFEYLDRPDFRAINFRSTSGETALHVALDDKRPSWAVLLLQRGADPNLARADGTPPILIAAERQDLQSMEALLRARANPNATNRAGETPLNLAVRLRNKDMVAMLLDRGANPDITDNSAGLSARDYARRDTRNPVFLAMIEASERPEQEVAEEEEEGLTFGPILR